NAKFLMEMRKYMPTKHRLFLQKVEKLPPLRNYVYQGTPKLREVYFNCVKQLEQFRDSHALVIHRYITKQDLDISKNPNGDRGSGGTKVAVFARDMRND